MDHSINLMDIASRNINNITDIVMLGVFSACVYSTDKSYYIEYNFKTKLYDIVTYYPNVYEDRTVLKSVNAVINN